MEFERKHYIYIMLAIIFSIVAISAEISTDDLNNKYNKTNETDYLETPRIYYQSGSTNNFLSMNSGSVLAWQINNSATSNKIELQITKTKLYNDLDMNNYNITNCLNCGSGTDNLSWQSEKMNKSGDNITGNMNFISIYKNDTPAGFSGLNDLTPVVSGVGYYGKMVYTFGVNRFLNATGYWKNGTYENRTGVALTVDSQAGLSKMPVFQVAYFRENQTTYTYWFQSDNSSTRILEGNLKISNLSGTGNAFACLDSTGTLIRSTVSCDLI